MFCVLIMVYNNFLPPSPPPSPSPPPPLVLHPIYLLPSLVICPRSLFIYFSYLYTSLFISFVLSLLFLLTHSFPSFFSLYFLIPQVYEYSSPPSPTSPLFIVPPSIPFLYLHTHQYVSPLIFPYPSFPLYLLLYDFSSSKLLLLPSLLHRSPSPLQFPLWKIKTPNRWRQSGTGNSRL